MSTTTTVPNPTQTSSRFQLPNKPVHISPRASVQAGQREDEEAGQGDDEAQNSIVPDSVRRSSHRRRTENVPKSASEKIKSRKNDTAAGPSNDNLPGGRRNEEELAPRDSASQVGGNRSEIRASMAPSQISVTSSIARKQEELQRRVILQIMRDEDLTEYLESDIPDQRIVFEGEIAYSQAQPNIRINWHSGIPKELEEQVQKENDFGDESEPDPADHRQNRREQTAPNRNHTTRQPSRGNDNNRNDRLPLGNGRDYRRDRRFDNRGRETPPHMSRRREERPARQGAGGGPPGGPPGPGNGGEGSNDSSEDRSEDELGRKVDPRVQRQSRTPFQHDRFSSEGPNVQTTQVYEYDPTPRNEEEVLRAAFHRYEQLIKFYLYGAPANLNSAAQKAMLQNVPKPEKYKGSSDYKKFDEWIMGLIQWMNMADHCGPPTRYSASRKGQVITPTDLMRTNTIGSYLEGTALQWFRDEVQQVPEAFAHNPDPLAYRWTFMQVVNGLYQRFVHEASISQISDRFYAVTYVRKKGIKTMFSELKRWAGSMPIPPDVYTFKKRLLLLVPEAMCDDMTRIEKVSAERSSVNDIMQAAISCERSDQTGRYYASAREATEQSQRTMKRVHEDDTEPYSKSKPKSSKDRKGKHKEVEHTSPKKLQVVESRRYQITDHEKMRQEKKDHEKKRAKEAKTKPSKPYFPAGSCFDCGSFDHFRGNPKCPKSDNKEAGPSKPRLYRIAEEVQRDGERLFRLEASPDETQSEGSESSDGSTWVSYDELAGSSSPSDKSDVSKTTTTDDGSTDSKESNSDSTKSDSEPDPWGGSQFESDAADEGYVRGNSRSSSDQERSSESMGHMRELETHGGNEQLNSLNEDRKMDVTGVSDTEYHTASEGDATEEVYTLNFNEYMRSMTATGNGGFQAQLKPTTLRTYQSGKRPLRKAEHNRCLCAFVEINGVQAFVLFDSGSTADAISPDYARVAKLDVFQLDNPVTLQLGTKGSRSRISFGCVAPYRMNGGKLGDIVGKDYFDVANIDRYDAVVGTVFMRKHGIALDFEHNAIRMNGKYIPTLSEGDETRELARRYAKTVAPKFIPKEGEGLPVKEGTNKNEKSKEGTNKNEKSKSD
ncbi:hypothetical protein FB446DRAFT_832455 [Lentinula raphanica]|nr:hypothetical protein FB446DRAFT_832455 [Lentinula raphanica]